MSKKSNFDEMSLEELQTSLKKDNDALYNVVTQIGDDFLPKYDDKRQMIYLAGPWFDDKAMALMNAVKDKVNIVQNHTKFDVFFPMDQQEMSPLRVYNNNIENIKKCDMLVALISRKDVGTAYEIGLADALGKPIIMVGYDETCFNTKTNVMLAFSADICVPYCKFEKVLLNNLYREDCIKIKDEWEGKE